MSEEKKTIAERLDEIDGVVKKLENEDLPLEEALKAFEEGIALVRETNAKLTEAETHLKTLTGEGNPDEL